MKIIKHSGHVVDFDRRKLRHSLLRSGADPAVADDILFAIEKHLYEGITTKKIYKLAFSMLKKLPGSPAARYNLRTAMQQLGPAGFFFEKFVARLYLAQGYQARNNLTLNGKCVSHEVDVVLEKDGRIVLVECKFHARRESTSDVKVPMYILSRFNDLKVVPNTIFKDGQYFDDCIIVTNNRFTADALAFASCSGLQTLSWDTPDKNSLRQLIDHTGLYPVTCLTTLSGAEKDQLMILDIIMAQEIPARVSDLLAIGLSQNRIKNVLKEVSELCYLL